MSFTNTNCLMVVVQSDSREGMRCCNCNSNANVNVLVCETQGKECIYCMGESVSECPGFGTELTNPNR